MKAPFVGLLAILAIANAVVLELPESKTCKFIKSFGYPCEEHLAPTADGWMLSLQRIPHGKNSNNSTKGVVLFQHGLTDCSAGAVLNGPDESFPFIFADAGYDIWLGNNRGNGLSMIHNKYSPKDPEFWDFTTDDMAKYDIPAEIDYILGVTGARKLSYMGHSQGTYQAFAGFTINPSLADKVNLFVALAPVAYVGNVESIVLRVLAEFNTDQILQMLGLHEFSLPDAIHKLLPGICEWDPKLCRFVLELLSGPFPNLNQTRIPHYLQYEPNPTSVKNMAHWGQGVRSKKFQMFDYGEKGNKERYGQPTPPQYDLSKFPTNLKLALFCGSLDVLGDPKDVQLLLQHLPVNMHQIVHYETGYGHLDFILDPKANTRIFPLILQLIDEANGH